MKCCTKCKQCKEFIEFSKDKSKKDGLYSSCKVCVNKYIKSGSTLDLLNCTVEYLKLHLSSQFKEGMTWDNHGEWHIDHIRPCCSFDLSIEANQYICFNYSNLQPLWREDNWSKGGRYK